MIHITEAILALYAVKAAHGQRFWESDKRLLDETIEALRRYQEWDRPYKS